MKRVLILTASFGEGHNAAARNLQKALIQCGGKDIEVHLEDVFKTAYGGANRLSEKLYLGVINYAPALWQCIYDLINNTDLIKKQIGMLGAAKKELQRLLATYAPEWIISTYPGCNYLLDNIYRDSVSRPYRQATIITDSITINTVWHRCFSDLFFVPNPDTTEVLLRRRIPSEKIQTLGFPVPVEFTELRTSRKYPPEDGIWRVLYVINSAQHLAPPLVERLLMIPKIELTATYGHDEHLRDALQASAQKVGKKITLHGWIPDLPRIMAENHLIISKAGGATVQECLAAATPLIASQVIPGQEVGNAILLERHHAGTVADTPDKIISAVQKALENNGELLQKWHAGATSLSRPDASLSIAKFILNH
ncbi:MAG: glycosyltransferase [Chthoniobacterales bacterium]